MVRFVSRPSQRRESFRPGPIQESGRSAALAPASSAKQILPQKASARTASLLQPPILKWKRAQRPALKLTWCSRAPYICARAKLDKVKRLVALAASWKRHQLRPRTLRANRNRSQPSLLPPEFANHLLHLLQPGFSSSIIKVFRGNHHLLQNLTRLSNPTQRHHHRTGTSLCVR